MLLNINPEQPDWFYWCCSSVTPF